MYEKLGLPYLSLAGPETPEATAPLRVIVLDTAATDIVRGVAAHTTASPPAASATVVVSADTDEEEDDGDEDATPSTPAEAEGIGTNLGVVAVVFERISGLDKGRAANASQFSRSIELPD